jgi:hypothetical protein
MDVVYFELNNWFSGRDYPNEKPFTDWCGNDLNLYFCNEDWVKKNGLVVVCEPIDMSVNWCITAPREWVEKNCPKLLSDESSFYKIQSTCWGVTTTTEYMQPYCNFLRVNEDDPEDVPTGRFGTEFMEYSEENIGIHYVVDDCEVDEDAD